MMSVEVCLTAGGLLQRLEARGHLAGGVTGTNLACAALTALLRTAAETLSAGRGVRCTGMAPAEGSLTVVVETVAPEAADWVRGVTDFVVQGCRRLQAEAGGELEVRIQRRG